MLLNFALLLISYLSAPVAKGAVLHGVVLGNELGGAPVARVRIAAPGANPTETGESGDFTLRFPNAQPGDIVQVSVNRAGYVVVNYVELRVVLRRDPDAQILTLIICKEGEREQWAGRFFRFKSFDAIEQTYKDRLKQLEDTNQKSAARIAELEKERDQAKAAVPRGADELARVTPDKINDLYANAMSLFLNGKTEQAIALLDDGTLRESLVNARKRKDEAERAIAAAVESYLLKARILTLQFKFSDAENVYAEAVLEAPDDSEAHFYFALYALQMNKFDLAYREYKRALELVRKEDNSEALANTLINIGLVEFNEDKWSEARGHWEEALSIFKKMDQKSTKVPALGVAVALANLGMLDEKQNNFAQARQEYEGSLAAFETVNDEHADADTMCDVLKANIGMGNLELRDNHFDQARADYAKCAQILATLTQQNPYACPHEQDSVLNQLARIEQLQGNPEKARDLLQNLVRVLAALSILNEDMYRPYSAMALNNLGNVEMELHDVVSARGHYLQSLQYLQEMERKDPTAYLPVKARTLYNLGLLEGCCGSKDEAHIDLLQALDIRQKLIRQSPEVYLPDYADTLHGLGMVEIDQKDLALARTHYEQALSIFRDLSKQNADAFLPSVARILGELADLDMIENQTDRARGHLQEALQTYGLLSPSDAIRYQFDIGRIRQNLFQLQPGHVT